MQKILSDIRDNMVLVFILLYLLVANELIYHQMAHFMSSTCLKKLSGGKQIPEKVRNFSKIQLGEHLVSNKVNLYQVCNMISDERNFLEGQKFRFFRPSHDTASLIFMIVSMTSLNTSRTVPSADTN